MFADDRDISNKIPDTPKVSNLLKYKPSLTKEHSNNKKTQLTFERNIFQSISNNWKWWPWSSYDLRWDALDNAPHVLSISNTQNVEIFGQS